MSEKKDEESSSSKEPTNEENEDVISKCVGDFGKWQMQIIFFLSLFNIPCTWHIYVMTFQSSQPQFWCEPPQNFESLPPMVWRNATHVPSHFHKYDPCRVWDVDFENMTVEELLRADFQHSNVGTRPCTRWHFDEPEKYATITSQWNLVCSRKQLSRVAEMSFLVGVAVGGLVSGMVSDRFGRKKTLMVSFCLQIMLGVTIAFIPTLEVFIVLRAVLGFISVGVVFSGFVLCVEVVGGKWRTIAGVVYLIPVAIGYIIISGIAYFVRAWNDLQLAITIPGIVLLGLWWTIPESPRWLMALGRIEENVEILKEAARVNRRTLPPNVDKLLQQETNEDSKEKAIVLDLFRYPRLRRISLVMFVIWFAVYFIYYGLMMNLSNLGGDIYLNTVISGVVEIPSLAFSAFMLLRLGRKWPLLVTMVTSGIACILTVPFGKKFEWVTITLAMSGKFCIACSNAIMPIYTAELYPTVVRNLGVGMANVCAGIALVLVPYIWNLAEIDDRLPLGLLGLTGIVGGVSVLLLEETANRPLQKSLKER